LNFWNRKPRFCVYGEVTFLPAGTGGEQMRRAINICFILLVVTCISARAQNKSILGTITVIQSPVNEIEVKPDTGPAVSVKMTPATIVQRIAPGQTDLKNAETIKVSDVQKGDRVLVTLAANASDVLRILVMSASDIAKRDQADQQDWTRRGISGIVAAKNGNQIIFKVRTPQGEAQQVVSVSDKTVFKRYSADSVKFADAKPSKFEEVNVGDQLRARGNKSEDGMKVDAEEVVFGTFLTKAGSVVSVDVPGQQVTVKELGSGKQFTIKITADSRIKQMPNSPPSDARGGPPAPSGPRGNAAPPNLAQMVENLPAGKFDDIKPGSSIVVSSTQGTPDQVTAILLVTNADLLIRMATPPGSRGGVLTFGSGGGSGGGLGVLTIP
jgi:hypothetical protein